MEKDDISRKRLKKKVLDRWENEGGRLCDDLTKTPESSPTRKRERKVSKPSPGISAAEGDSPSTRNGKPITK